MSGEPALMSLVSVAKAIAGKKISSREVTQSCLDRIAQWQPRLNAFMSIIRGCQDLVGTFVLGGVFERHPRLRLVCVEADAGWVPHFMYRMDHAYDQHRY